VAVESPLVCIPNSKLAVVYFMNEAGLGILLPGDISDENLTNGLIIFDKPAHADLLFAMNGWDRKNLRLHTLSLGLRFVLWLFVNEDWRFNEELVAGTDNWM